MEFIGYKDIDKVLKSEFWPLVESPYTVIYILAAYLYFVLHLGPRLMKNRPAFSLTRILVGYNLYQGIFNLWLCLELFLVLKGLPCINKSCCAYQFVTDDTLRYPLTVLLAWYWFSKIIDLLDTVFFVLRKKFSQVTFLHMYHHVAMVLFVRVHMKYMNDDKHAVFVGIVNTFVHVVMYSYYLIAALGPKYQKFIWWKKYVTWLQLTQFGIIQVYLIMAAVMDCGISYVVVFFFSANVMTFTILFCNFYKKAYKMGTSKLPSKTE